MQIKLGARKVVTFSVREGEDFDNALERFIRKHSLPEVVCEVLRRRAELMQKNGALVRPHVMPRSHAIWTVSCASLTSILHIMVVGRCRADH